MATKFNVGDRIVTERDDILEVVLEHGHVVLVFDRDETGQPYWVDLDNGNQVVRYDDELEGEQS